MCQPSDEFATGASPRRGEASRDSVGASSKRPSEKQEDGPPLPPAGAARNGSVACMHQTSMVLLDGATFRMGSNDGLASPDDGEGPPHEVELDAFWIDA